MQSPSYNDLIVELYTHAGVINASIACPTDTRLLDLLNGFSTDRNGKGDFLELTNLSSTEPLTGEKPLEYVRKTAIMLVALSEANLGRGFGATGKTIFPFVPKTQVIVSLQVQDYTILGTAHLDKNQTLQDILNEEPPFMPLTEVTIAREYHLYGTRPFVAVNKQQIIHTRRELFSPVQGQIQSRAYSI